MKSIKFSLLTLAIIFSLNVEGAMTKRVYRSYPLNKVQKVQVSNKYGHIYIDDNRKDSVVIDVKIWVEGNDERAKKLLDKISAEVNLQNSTVVAVTNVESFSNNGKDFGIDYHIAVPADRDLSVEQKYGTVSMKNLTGKGDFSISYGELTASRLLSPALKMEIAYSKANIEETGNLDLDLKYSKFFLDKCAEMKAETRYSDFNLGEMKAMKADSKYDQYRISSISALKMNSMYSGIRINKLTSALDLENGYGNITVEQIPVGFDNINVVNRYAGVKLGISQDASYKLDGKVRYCELRHPEGNLNKNRQNTSYEVNGLVGKNSSSRSIVTIVSNYGSVNLIP